MSTLVGAVIVVGLTTAGCATTSTSSTAPAAAQESNYTTDTAGLTRAMTDCAGEVLSGFKVPADGDLMGNASLVDSALTAVGNCVVKKNPEYLCGPIDGGLPGCFFSDTAIEGLWIDENSAVEAAMAKAGAPGY